MADVVALLRRGWSVSFAARWRPVTELFVLWNISRLRDARCLLSHPADRSFHRAQHVHPSTSVVFLPRTAQLDRASRRCVAAGRHSGVRWKTTPSANLIPRQSPLATHSSRALSCRPLTI